MRNHNLLVISGMFAGMLVLSGCMNPPTSVPDRNNLVYAANIDQTMDAIEKTLTRMRWQITGVDNSIPNRLILDGVQMQSGRDTSGDANPANYRFVISIASVGRNTTQVTLDIHTSGYGGSRAQQSRRIFFNHLEQEGLVRAASE